MAEGVHNRGAFVVIEGGDGAGKDTQVEQLRKAYAGRDDILFTRDPGGTATAHEIRQLLLREREEELVVRSELLLFLAARVQLIERQIEPARSAGISVICQRLDLSTYAYQVAGRQRPELKAHLDRLNAFATEQCMPDRYLLLDIDVETAIARTRDGKGDARDRLEREARDFHDRVQDAFRQEAARRSNVVTVDARGSVSAVHERVRTALQPLLDSD
jgi:dTMP kinase